MRDQLPAHVGPDPSGPAHAQPRRPRFREPALHALRPLPVGPPSLSDPLSLGGGGEQIPWGTKGAIEPGFVGLGALYRT